MTKKQLWAAMIYIVAIALPTAALGVRYGFDTNVNLTNSPEALHQLLAMATGIFCGVVISLIGSRLLGSESENLLGFTSRVLRQLNQQSAAQQRWFRVSRAESPSSVLAGTTREEERP